MTEPPKLRLIRSQQYEPIKLDNIEVYCGTEITDPPFSVDVKVVEEDTWQVLSADNSARVIDEHPIRLMTGLIDQQPLSAGTLVVKANRWLAVIMDFDQDPVCQRDWIIDVYKQIFEQVVNDHVDKVSMPLLGVRHKCVEISDSLNILIDSINILPEDSCLSIWLKLSEKDVQASARLLEKIANN